MHVLADGPARKHRLPHRPTTRQPGNQASKPTAGNRRRLTAPFYNGKDLSGWEGLLDQFWSVKDGAIVGSTGPKGNNFNTFLCSKKKYKDFELQFQVKLTGKGWTGNSGVQIRSKIADPKKFSVSGPQCDMGADTGAASTANSSAA